MASCQFAGRVVCTFILFECFVPCYGAIICFTESLIVLTSYQTNRSGLILKCSLIEPHMEKCTHPTGSQPAKDVCLLTPATVLPMSLPQRQSIYPSSHNSERMRKFFSSDRGTRIN
ncbi:uncharacterized protein BO72DRAFT_446704 [Aspergillus fijiensis CBS 313.89]|uniref:Uncharacterized protein n=1 Tax=Aspergillus fijiensis CBS 313.89 TaxID=1448319 RepID=A0A8G1RT16_9EURO|nr:uncharacterized protein BO72DRAFT_446704 [Aspergillus fijiensis CBS 313.89]RAK78950.1 hypothetical protein BO72DRAFT_446704 [Aspergillus fijiensis CBS 313.89]